MMAVSAVGMEHRYVTFFAAMGLKTARTGVMSRTVNLNVNIYSKKGKVACFGWGKSSFSDNGKKE